MTIDEDHRSSSEDRPLDVLVVGAGPTGLVPAASWSASTPPRRTSPAGSATTVTPGQLQTITHRHTGGLSRLHDPLWTSDFRIQCRAASHHRAGRVFLAGDAAHVHSPTGTQGTNTGIQDAVNPDWKLALPAAAWPTRHRPTA